MGNQVPSRQEMFDRAVRGLRSQEWRRCVRDGQCLYVDGGRHCAWGWVDPSVPNREGPVNDLRSDGIGLASHLNQEELAFAMGLQRAHDNALDLELEKEMRAFGLKHGLTWPV